jgi:flagellar biosynthetic protein FlhB
VSLFVNIAQVGLMISTKPLEFKWDRISPNLGKWMKRSFYSAEAFFNLFKSMAKLAIIIAIGYVIITRNLPSLVRISEFPAMVGVSLVAGAIVQVFLASFVVLLVFGIADYVFQRRLFIESVKMSKQEIKEERKQAEGDPLLKSRIKERMRQVLAQNIRKVVPKADVIITNPTHYAVALEWDSERMIAPQVIAKGVDGIALSIIEVAAEASVPRVENRPLARALYASVEIGDPVPPEYWELVSQILAEVYTLNQKLVKL